MTNFPEPAAFALLPSGRAVTVGDCLTRDEAQDLLFIQQGPVPLRPLAQARDRYLVVGGLATPAMVLAAMFVDEPPLTISELQAISLEERWVSCEDNELLIPVPVGGGQFVAKKQISASLEQLCAFFDEQCRWAEEIAEALRRTAGSPRGIA